MTTNDLPEQGTAVKGHAVSDGDFDFPSKEAMEYYASIEPQKGVITQSLKDTLGGF